MSTLQTFTTQIENEKNPDKLIELLVKINNLLHNLGTYNKPTCSEFLELFSLYEINTYRKIYADIKLQIQIKLKNTL